MTLDTCNTIFSIVNIKYLRKILHLLVVDVLHAHAEGVLAVPRHAALAHRAVEVEHGDVAEGEPLAGAAAGAGQARLAEPLLPPLLPDLGLEGVEGACDVHRLPLLILTRDLAAGWGLAHFGLLQHTFVQQLALLNVTNPIGGFFNYTKNLFLLIFGSLAPSFRLGFCKF